MSVNSESGECAAYKKAHEAACVSGEFDHTVKEWDEFYDLREALIWALLITKFPHNSRWKITEKNWEEIYQRLYILEKVNGAYRSYFMGNDKPNRKVYFTPEEIYSMIGMSVNAGNLTTAKYKTYIYKELNDRAIRKLDEFRKKLKEPENVK
jgi:hypothetical protein